MSIKSSLFAMALVAIAIIGVSSIRQDRFMWQDAQAGYDPSTAPDRSLLTSGFSKVDRLPADRDTTLEIAQAETTQTRATAVTPFATTTTQATAATAADATSASQKVDETALRYFASRGDTARLQAEISRLRALYPNWVAPKDPLAVPQNEDIQLETMWKLYSDGRYADVRKAIADRQSADAAWKPPADLLDRLSVAEARGNLVRASDQKQYDTVVRIASEATSLLTCSEVDVLWRVAEAFASTGRQPRARDAYLYILNNCDKPEERLATVQKASALLRYGMITELLATERPGTDGALEFEAIRDDLARRFVAEGNGDAALVVDPQYLARVERLAQTGGLASDALLLGWYHLRRNAMEPAEKWFRQARARENDPSAAQGLALTLMARKAPQEAEDVMYAFRDETAGSKATYLAATANVLAIAPPAVLTAEVLQRIAKVVIEAKDAPTAQQFGWYSRALEQDRTAADWFSTALRWKTDDEASAYGLAITLKQLRDEAGLRDIQRLWAARSERIATLGEPATGRDSSRGRGLLSDPAAERPATADADQTHADRVSNEETDAIPTVVKRRLARQDMAANERRGRRTPGLKAGCATTIDPRQLSPSAALDRGWCLMEMKRPMEAVSAFEVALSGPGSKTREDAAYGQSLAYLRAGLTANAAVAAARMPQSRKRAAEVQVAILTDRASAASAEGRNRETILILDQLAQLRPDRVDLMVMRGYAYLNLKRYDDAYKIFAAAARTGNRDAMRGMADVRSSQGGSRL